MKQNDLEKKKRLEKKKIDKMNELLPCSRLRAIMEPMNGFSSLKSPNNDEDDTRYPYLTLVRGNERSKKRLLVASPLYMNGKMILNRDTIKTGVSTFRKVVGHSARANSDNARNNISYGAFLKCHINMQNDMNNNRFARQHFMESTQVMSNALYDNLYSREGEEYMKSRLYRKPSITEDESMEIVKQIEMNGGHDSFEKLDGIRNYEWPSTQRLHSLIFTKELFDLCKNPDKSSVYMKYNEVKSNKRLFRLLKNQDEIYPRNNFSNWDNFGKSVSSKKQMKMSNSTHSSFIELRLPSDDTSSNDETNYVEKGKTQNLKNYDDNKSNCSDYSICQMSDNHYLSSSDDDSNKVETDSDSDSDFDDDDDDAADQIMKRMKTLPELKMTKNSNINELIKSKFGIKQSEKNENISVHYIGDLVDSEEEESDESSNDEQSNESSNDIKEENKFGDEYITNNQNSMDLIGYTDEGKLKKTDKLNSEEEIENYERDSNHSINLVRFSPSPSPSSSSSKSQPLNSNNSKEINKCIPYNLNNPKIYLKETNKKDDKPMNHWQTIFVQRNPDFKQYVEHICEGNIRRKVHSFARDPYKSVVNHPNGVIPNYDEQMKDDDNDSLNSSYIIDRSSNKVPIDVYPCIVIKDESKEKVKIPHLFHSRQEMSKMYKGKNVQNNRTIPSTQREDDYKKSYNNYMKQSKNENYQTENDFRKKINQPYNNSNRNENNFRYNSNNNYKNQNANRNYHNNQPYNFRNSTRTKQHPQEFNKKFHNKNSMDNTQKTKKFQHENNIVNGNKNFKGNNRTLYNQNNNGNYKPYTNKAYTNKAYTNFKNKLKDMLDNPNDYPMDNNQTNRRRVAPRQRNNAPNRPRNEDRHPEKSSGNYDEFEEDRKLTNKLESTKFFKNARRLY
ncbi:hypothetical protein SNEBB_000246 [Seison nebaliae]|nr:hypothetical protein SNEBB_000246 [Seison nebaliae]